MKHLIPFLALICLAHVVSAQLHIMGTVYDAAASSTSIIRWNALTGVPTDTIETPSQYVLFGSSVFDAFNNQYYFTGENGTYRVDFNADTTTSTGSVIPGNSAEFDMTSGEIFRIKFDNVYNSTGVFISTTASIVSTNAATGIDSTLGIIPHSSGLYLDASCYNSNAGIYYFVGLDSVLGTCIYGVHTRDSVFNFTQVPLPPSAVSIITMEYDNENDIIYALAALYSGTGSLSSIQIQQVDPLTGAMTLEANFPQFNSYQVGTCSFDQTTGSMIFILGAQGSSLDLYIYSTVTNSLTSGLTPPALINEFECDNVIFAQAKYGTSTRVEDQVSEVALSLYPNPASDILQVRVDAPVAALYVTDAIGRTREVVYSGDKLDVRMLEPGYYVLQVQFRDGTWSHATFVKQ